LYEKEKKQGQEEILIRPFFSSYKEPISASFFKSSFYPLYHSMGTNKWDRWSFLFLWGGESFHHDDVGIDKDNSIAPFFLWGSGDTDRENYFAFFPFYGSINSKFSWSKISFFLFPVYAKWQHKDFEAHSVLWPLFLYGNNDIRKEIRFFPFFSSKSHKGKFSHTSMLWPFFSWGRNYLDKKEPVSYSFFWLLFSYKKSYFGNLKSYGIIPIIGSISLFSYGYDDRTSEENFNILFLYQYGINQNKDYFKRIIFPFYGYSRFANKEFLFITPFYMRMQTNTYLLKSNSYYLIPFFHYQFNQYIKEETDSTYLKIWPFFKYSEDIYGNFSWNTLSFFPVKSESIDKIYDPIVSIVEYSSFSNGEKRLSFLMRLYSQNWDEEKFQWKVPILMNYSNSEKNFQFQFLMGLLGFERTDDKNTYQMLWFLKL
jgi:hypothetical protein